MTDIDRQIADAEARLQLLKLQKQNAPKQPNTVEGLADYMHRAQCRVSHEDGRCGYEDESWARMGDARRKWLAAATYVEQMLRAKGVSISTALEICEAITK